MALIDEEKLQGHVYEILQLLRKQAVCCPKIAADFYCVDGTISWVVTSQDGTVTVYDAPNGNVVTGWASIVPLINGACGV